MKKFIKSKLDQERALTPTEPPAFPGLPSFSLSPNHSAPPPLPPPPPPPPSPDIDSNVCLKQEILDFGIRGRIIIQNATTTNSSSPGANFVPICRDFVRGNCSRNGNCKFAHRSDDVSQMMKVYTFCHQFQNSVCSYVDCKFVHASIFDQIKFYRTGILPSEALAHRASSNPATAPLVPRLPTPPLPPSMTYWSPSLLLLPPPPPPLPPLYPSPLHQSQSLPFLPPPSPSPSLSPPPLPPLLPSPLMSPSSLSHLSPPASPSPPPSPPQSPPPPPTLPMPQQLLTASLASSPLSPASLLPENFSRQLPQEHVFKIPTSPPLRKRKRSSSSATSSADASSAKRQRTENTKHSYCPCPEHSEPSDGRQCSEHDSTSNIQHDEEDNQQQPLKRKNDIIKRVSILLTPLSPTLCKWLEERTDSRLPPGIIFPVVKEN